MFLSNSDKPQRVGGTRDRATSLQGLRLSRITINSSQCINAGGSQAPRPPRSLVPVHIHTSATMTVAQSTPRSASPYAVFSGSTTLPLPAAVSESQSVSKPCKAEIVQNGSRGVSFSCLMFGSLQRRPASWAPQISFQNIHTANERETKQQHPKTLKTFFTTSRGGKMHHTLDSCW